MITEIRRDTECIQDMKGNWGVFEVKKELIISAEFWTTEELHRELLKIREWIEKEIKNYDKNGNSNVPGDE